MGSKQINQSKLLKMVHKAYTRMLQLNTKESMLRHYRLLIALERSQSMEVRMNTDMIKMVMVFVVLSIVATGCGSLADRQGPQGSTGAVGSNGSQGVSGATGPQGAVGGQGARGEAGADGVNGSNGLPCTVVAYTGGVQIVCPDGSTQVVLNGVDGSDATPVTTVEFCGAGYEATYPTVFPEYGLIIGGKLYGVYSANGGFLAAMPAGAYTSNGINASCNFTVNADNSITQN